MGRGLSTSENVAVGSGVAVVFTIFMCTCGLPLIVTGVILIQISVSHTTGIVILVVSGVIILITIVMIIMICSGVFNKTGSVSPAGRGRPPNTAVPVQPPPYSYATPHSPPPSYSQMQVIPTGSGGHAATPSLSTATAGVHTHSGVSGSPPPLLPPSTITATVPAYDAVQVTSLSNPV